MRILSIDPATSSGYTIFEDGEMLENGFFKSPERDLGYRLKNTYNFFSELIDKGDIDEVCFEDFKVGKLASAAESSYGYRAIIRLLCSQRYLKYEVINVSEWKKFIAGRATPTKEQKEKYGKDANKMFIVEELKKRGFTLPDMTENKATGRLSNTPFDCWDSIGIGLFFLSILQKR
jgi:Holliday junction resolvasome RuvABC endonuclease subunit